jgi:acetolactate decarboxylase
MNKLLMGAMAIFLFSCKEKQVDHQYEVQYHGALKTLMMEGDLTGTTSLVEYENIPNLYALGAVEDLKGEIQIFNSKVYNTYVQNDSLQFDSTYTVNAALLVFAQVPSWRSINIPDTIKSSASLEQFIAMAADENEQDIEEPFPFLLEGEVNSLRWHVIDWKEGDSIHSPQKHKESGLQGTIKNQKVEVLGFYSNSHHRIFTHHSSNVHMHFRTKDDSLAGHIDELLPGEMVLKLPEAN